MLHALAAVAGVLLIAIALLDAFETIVLPRRITRQLRLVRIFYRFSWRPWKAMADHLPTDSRENFLGFFGPLSLILLLTMWAAFLIVGFALLGWGAGSALTASGNKAGFGSALYLSGETFFTLGLGDVRPDSSLSRAITVIEAGFGFGFLALVITYLPVLYQSFSRREVNVSLLDARAGSPPSAGEFLRRLAALPDIMETLNPLLQEWERWAGELLETHMSYPVLTLYRSQHERQSWLAALTCILDVAALVLAGDMKAARPRAALTFAMARHAAVDLSQVLPTTHEAWADRLPAADFQALTAAGRSLLTGLRQDELTELRRSYETHLQSLSRYLRMPLPPWLPSAGKDAWQSSPWA